MYIECFISFIRNFLTIMKIYIEYYVLKNSILHNIVFFIIEMFNKFASIIAKTVKQVQ
jgi:hypothetical protein